MGRFGLTRYLGILFMIVVIAPAVVLSLLAIRAIGREEAYIEKQLEGTLSAEVTHVSSVVSAEIGQMQAELASYAPVPEQGAPQAALEQWKRSSRLVGIPFILSPEHEILWPRPLTISAADTPDADKEAAFLETQRPFLSDEEKTLVYENIAVAYQNEILEAEDYNESKAREGGAGAVPHGQYEREGSAGPGETPPTPEADDRQQVAYPMTAVRGEIPQQEKKARETQVPVAEERAGEKPGVERHGVEPQGLARSRMRTEALKDMTGGALPGQQSRKQTAITTFEQSEPVRKKVYDKAEIDGQEIAFRNVQLADRGEAAQQGALEGEGGILTYSPDETEEHEEESAGEPPGAVAPAGEKPATRETGGIRRESEDLGRIRSIFISQPLSFSEIVADAKRGIIPRTVDGRLQHLYWQRLHDGNILGCLVNAGELRDRIIGALPDIYSPVRILTVLDESGTPLVLPEGIEERNWRMPFVAEEISELLPRWEAVAYLTEPDAISSRAQFTTTVMWTLILILFVSIVAGSVLVLRSAAAEVRLAQQRTTFVANVSHELKTPLTSIRMFAEMLRDGRQPDPERQKHYLDIMTAEAERLTRLINNVLDFSRMERGEKHYNMGSCDLVSLSMGVTESQRARLENNGFEVVFTARGGQLTAVADEEAVKQALVNLLSNAEKYSARRKKIEVEIGREGYSAVISVKDRGVGIKPGEAGKVFNEFYRTDDTLTSKVKGAGLGLTIARRIIRDHNGDVRYRQRDGGGSVFEIVLPLEKDEK